MPPLDPLDALPREALDPRNARQGIIDRLRNGIRSGVLPAGMAIRQQQIADHYNVSRMPVREAIRALETQGFLIPDLNRGSRVAELGAHPSGDARDAFMILYGPLLRRWFDECDGDPSKFVEQMVETCTRVNGPRGNS